MRPLLDRAMPESWLGLSIDAEDALYLRWSGAVLKAAARLGKSEIFVELSDSLGRERLTALPECSPLGAHAFRCEATAEAIDAIVLTNPGFLVQTVNQIPCLSVVDAWSGMLLHVEEPTVIDASISNSLVAD
jgi:hypothetical protein